MLNVPKSLKLMSASEVSNSVRRREKITIYPTGGQKISGVSSGGDIIEFKIPASTNSVDMSTFFIHGTIQINKSAASSIAFLHDSIESIIDELTITIGNNSQQIENIKNYNRLESALQPYCSGDFANSFGGSCMALGLSVSERKSLYNNWNASTTTGKVVSFSIPLRFSGVSNPAISIMPGNVFNQSSFMMVRIKLASAASCICAYTSSDIDCGTNGAITGGARTALPNGATYSLDSLRATVDIVETSNEYQQMMQEFLASQSLQYPIQTFDVNIRNLPAGQASHIETLTLQYKNIDALFFWFNLSSELRQFDYCGEDRLHVPSVAGVEVIKSLQLKINGVNVPNSAINLEYGASEALCHTVEALQILHFFENNGGLNFPKSVTSHYAISSAGGVTVPLYSEATSNRFYGRMKRKVYSSGRSGTTNANSHEDTSNVKLYTALGTLNIQEEEEVNPYLNDLSPSSFLIGVNMRKLLDLEPEVLSGSNLQATSGGITYEIQYTTPGTSPNFVPAYELGVACLHTRFINFTPSGANVDF